MKNIELLFNRNSAGYGRIKIDNNHVITCNIHNTEGMWTGREINRMISFVNQMKKQFRGEKVPIFFVLNGSVFIDKLTYVYIECICYYLVLLKHPVQIFMTVKRDIGTEGISSSPLLLLKRIK